MEVIHPQVWEVLCQFASEQGWQLRQGKYCYVLSAPELFLEDECETVEDIEKSFEEFLYLRYHGANQ